MRNKLAILAVVALALGAATAPVLANWDPGDDYKIHFPQLPDESGWDVAGSEGCRVADDFQCAETGLIKGIHFWGSWWGGDDQQEPNGTFQFRIYSNNPGPPSMPDQLLWSYDVVVNSANVTTEAQSAPGQTEGWYVPCEEYYESDDHEDYYQYDVTLPDTSWFYQREGEIYWLEIYRDGVVWWGWKTADKSQYPTPYTGQRFMDAAVFNDGSGWTVLLDPELFTANLDMAFVLTGGPAPPAVPTLSQISLILLVLLLAAGGAVSLIRRRTRARAV
jgi:hypothetical protein